MNILQQNNATLAGLIKESNSLLDESDCLSKAKNAIFYFNNKQPTNQIIQNQTNSSEYNFNNCDTNCYCENLYTNLFNTDFGRIGYKLIKPFFSGKILFTPNIPIIKNLILKINQTFLNIDQTIQISNDLINLINTTIGILNTSNNKDIINSLLKSSQLDSENINVENVLNDMIYYVKSYELAKKLFSCFGFELNRFIGVENENEIEKLQSQLNLNQTFLAAIVFENSSSSDLLTNNSLPRIVSYKIRMRSNVLPDTEKSQRDSYLYGQKDDWGSNKYFYFGFAYLQDLIEKAIVEMKTNSEQKFGISAQGK